MLNVVPAPAQSPAVKLGDILELTLSELEKVVGATGEPSYRACQVMRWLWTGGAASFEAMRQVPVALRQYLNQRFRIGRLPVLRVAKAADGTRKLLLGLEDGLQIESVIIPMSERTTLCLSTQAGCAMGCTFCATAQMGLHRNLAAGEILEQIVAARGELETGAHFSNYVFMGMGEPLANYPRLARALTVMTADWGLAISPRRITVSTVGIVPMMHRLLTDFEVNLAVSLHATRDQLRGRLIPINRRYPLTELLAGCRRLPLSRRRRITFEYVMLAGINDSAEDAACLLRILAPLKAKLNLILFNPFPGAAFRPSPRQRVEDFQAILRRGNLTVTLRESRGQDIAAACGQLYAERRAVSA